MSIASYIDHTLLKPEATHEDIRRVCEEENVLSKEELDKALDPRRMIKPLD